MLYARPRALPSCTEGMHVRLRLIQHTIPVTAGMTLTACVSMGKHCDLANILPDHNV